MKTLHLAAHLDVPLNFVTEKHAWIGAALRDHWLKELSGGERRILEVVLERHPDAVERAYLSELTGYARSSRDTFLQRLGARRLVDAQGSAVKASDLLF